jgi:dolichol-phosphate mannosyltransferase
MATTVKRVVIISPTYNEKGNIGQLVETLEETIFPRLGAEWEAHILIVDDSSPDGTANEVRSFQQKYTNLHLLINPKKAGLGNAYTKGMDYALEKLGADVMVEFDADLQHDPEKIPLMLEKISDGYDVVVGSRYIPGGGIPSNWGLWRKFLSVVGNLVARIFIGHLEIHDWTGGFRAVTKEVVKTVLPELTDERFMGYTFQIGFLNLVVRKGYKVTEVPFVFRDRKYGESKIPANYLIIALKYVVRVRIKNLTASRLFKFAVVGTIGAMIQLSTLQLFRHYFPYQLAYFLSVELAVISNFILSNTWTFADRVLKLSQIPFKFVEFNLASMGSILIQQVFAFFGENYIGLFTLFSIPVLGYEVDTGFIFAVIGILLGMVWNYFAYSRIVWKQKT